MSNLETARAWINGMNDHNVEKMFSVCKPDLIGREIAEPHPNIGRDAVAATYVDLFRGFPDSHCEILNEFTGGEQVLVEVRWIGTNSGPFRGTPPTNKVVDVPIAYIFKFGDDRIERITEYYDGATVGAQLS
jgi:steroid delta-isomerase-like uncharacterized protein